jgi:plastocyanin
MPSSCITVNIVANNFGMSFSPANASLTAGQCVKWHNAHSQTHTATSDGGSPCTFDTGNISPGATSAAVAISCTAGQVPTYHCKIHPSMTGSLTVN